MQVLHNMFQGNPQSITVTSELNGQLINVSEIPLVFMKCDEFSKHLYILAHLDRFMQLKATHVNISCLKHILCYFRPYLTINPMLLMSSKQSHG